MTAPEPGTVPGCCENGIDECPQHGENGGERLYIECCGEWIPYPEPGELQQCGTCRSTFAVTTDTRTGEKAALPVPRADPASSPVRLMRAIFGACPDCDRTDEHEHTPRAMPPRLAGRAFWCGDPDHAGRHPTPAEASRCYAGSLDREPGQ
jgi:hypothetical protein